MTTELGRLVNALCNAAIAYGEQTEYASDEHSAMLEAEKALLEYVERELVWKNEDPRMLREQIRVADVAFNGLQERHNALERELAKLREGAERIAADYEGTGYKVTRELRALLK